MQSSTEAEASCLLKLMPHTCPEHREGAPGAEANTTQRVSALVLKEKLNLLPVCIQSGGSTEETHS